LAGGRGPASMELPIQATSPCKIFETWSRGGRFSPFETPETFRTEIIDRLYASTLNSVSFIDGKTFLRLYFQQSNRMFTLLNPCSTRNCILIALASWHILNPALANAAAAPQTLAWWRLNEDSVFQAVEGMHDLEFWSKVGLEPSYEGPASPPAGMLREGLDPAGGSLAISESLQNAQGGFYPKPEMDLVVTSDGITVEGFFNTISNWGVQTIISAGEGLNDTSWSITLSSHGSLLLSIFEPDNLNPALCLEIMGDYRDERWNFFAAWLLPPSSSDPGYLRLLVVSEEGEMQLETVEWPLDVSMRDQGGNVQIGRSSRYFDLNPENTHIQNTLGGNLSDIRISTGIREKSDLLGKIPASR